MLNLIIWILIIGILIISYNKCKSLEFKKFFKFSYIVLGILLVLEVSLFNYRHYQSLFYKEIKINNYTLGADIKENSDGSLQVIGDDDNYIEIDGINAHLDNMFINFDMFLDKSDYITIHPAYTDAANKRYAYIQDRRVFASNKNDGEIMHLQFTGKTKRLKMYLNTREAKQKFVIKEISFNKQVPLNISLVRPFMIYLLLVLIYIFNPKSSLYSINLFDRKSKKYIMMAVGFELVFMIIVSFFNFYFVREKFETLQRYQYQMLAESFMEGHTYLNVEPDDILKSLSNPYDKKDRNRAYSKVYDDDPENHYIWDAAYYKGKYYVYFGVAPVILYYLPVYALTGHHIRTSTCITITMILTVIGVFLLLYDICKKWFKKVNLGAFLAFTLLFVNASGLLSIMGRPDHYSLPILMAIMFSIYGLYFWLKAERNNLKPVYLFLGSLCMASVAACRPQILLTSFFAIPIFYDKVFKERKLFSKDSIKETLAFIAPYIVIAILLMMYNYARFGSPVDFGANYNLTTNDMTKRGFMLDRIPLGIFYYLFRPITITPLFPFMITEGVSTSYFGTTIFEDMPAGFIMSNLLVIFALGLFIKKDEFKDKKLYNIGIWAVIASFIIIIADTEMAGILPRYICDFGFLLYLATALVLFNKLNKEKDSKIFSKLIFYAFIFGMVYNFMIIFNDSIICKTSIFFYLRQLFMFWL
ncbi:MAG: hypothetical protein NC483_05880 [Ruminococcus sp.]|nr:hypothetical protein [Ruminococcus sp.]